MRQLDERGEIHRAFHYRLQDVHGLSRDVMRTLKPYVHYHSVRAFAVPTGCVGSNFLVTMYESRILNLYNYVASRNLSFVLAGEDCFRSRVTSCRSVQHQDLLTNTVRQGRWHG